MPIGLEQWRMQIGALEAQRYRYLSRASRKAARGGRVRVGRISGGCLVGIVLCVTLLFLATSFSLRLLLAGDIERNPGPLPDELLSTIDNSELAADDLRAVYKEVHTLAGRWRAMCLSLGLSDSETEITAATYPNNPHDCFRDVILKWLKKVYNFQQYGPPTWRMLIEAVADPAGGNDPALAERIAKAHQAAVVFPPTPSSLQAAIGSPGHIAIPAHQQQQLDPQETHCHLVSRRDTSTEDGSHASSSGLVTDKGYHPTSETGSTTEENQFPYLYVTGLSQEEKDTLNGRLQKESMQIMIKFQRLVDTFRKSLNVPVTELASHLSLLGAFTAVKPQRPLLEDCLPQIRAAPTIDDAFWNLRHYYSFFNYLVIEHIIESLGTEGDKSNLQKYKEDLKQYSKRRCYECPSCLAKPSDVGKMLIVKLDVNFEPYSVEQLQIFKCHLSQILQISEGALKLCYIEKGCIQFTFQIPSFMEKEIFPLSYKRERALIDEGVLDLRCGEYEFSAECMEAGSDPLRVAIYPIPDLAQDELKGLKTFITSEFEKCMEAGSDPLRVAIYPIPDLAQDKLKGLKDFITSEFKKVSNYPLVLSSDADLYNLEMLKSKYLTNAVDAYDIMEIDTVLLGELVEANRVRQLEDVTVTKCFPSSVQSVTIDGKVYGVPTRVCANFLMELTSDEHHSAKPLLHEWQPSSNLKTILDRQAGLQQHIQLAGDCCGSWKLPFLYLEAYVDKYGDDSFHRAIDADAPIDEHVVEMVKEFVDLGRDRMHVGNPNTDGTYHTNHKKLVKDVVESPHILVYAYSETLGEILHAAGKRKSVLSLVCMRKSLTTYTDALVVNKAKMAKPAKESAIEKFIEFYAGLDFRTDYAFGRDLPTASPRLVLPARLDFFTKPEAVRNKHYCQFHKILTNHSIPAPNHGVYTKKKEIKETLERYLHGKRSCHTVAQAH